jgi:hypothetical protein
LVKDLDNIKLNYEELEQMFAQKKKEETKKEEKVVVQKVTLVDPKKGNNAAIVLGNINISLKIGSLRMKNEEILKSLLEIKENVLKTENIQALYELVPTGEEMQQINDYVNDGKSIDLLGTCERYFLVIQSVPRLQERLKCWIFKNNFFTQVGEIQPDINATLKTIEDLLEAEGFVQLLQIILAVGNYINSTKNNGQVHGFQIASLLKLRDHKSGTGVTLLQYIYEYILRNYEGLQNWYQDLDTISVCARVNTQAVKTELLELKKGLNEIEKEIDFVENYYFKFNGDPPNDYFASIMKDFMGDASEQYEILEKKWELIETKIEELRKFYGEETKSFKFEDFINNINKFISDWKESIADYDRRKEIQRKKDDKEKKLQQEKEKKEQQRLEKLEKKKKEEVKIEETKIEEVIDDNAENNDKVKIDMNVNKKSEGVLDDLTQNMLDGSAFGKNKKKKKKKEDEVGELLKQLDSNSGSNSGVDLKKKKKNYKYKC